MVQRSQRLRIIQRPGGEDVFVHYRAIVGNRYKNLNEGDQVQFDVEKAQRSHSDERQCSFLIGSLPVQRPRRLPAGPLFFAPPTSLNFRSILIYSNDRWDYGSPSCSTAERTRMSSEVPAGSVFELVARYTYGTWRFGKGWKPLHIVEREGLSFYRQQRPALSDFSSQLMCVTLGHKNPAVIAAIVEQARKLPYIGPGFATDVRARFSLRLLDVLPEGLEKFFFTTSGTEANEAAFKIARMVTGKTKIISRYRSYHGSTMGSVAATGDPRRWAMEPAGKIPGVIFAPEVHCYKCPLLHHVSRMRHRVRRIHRPYDRERKRCRRGSCRAGGRNRRRTCPA